MFELLLAMSYLFNNINTEIFPRFVNVLSKKSINYATFSLTQYVVASPFSLLAIAFNHSANSADTLRSIGPFVTIRPIPPLHSCYANSPQ